jgi:hypothetical protein
MQITLFPISPLHNLPYGSGHRAKGKNRNTQEYRVYLSIQRPRAHICARPHSPVSEFNSIRAAMAIVDTLRAMTVYTVSLDGARIHARLGGFCRGIWV